MAYDIYIYIIYIHVCTTHESLKEKLNIYLCI